jgi:hypothetical protein
MPAQFAIDVGKRGANLGRLDTGPLRDGRENFIGEHGRQE